VSLRRLPRLPRPFPSITWLVDVDRRVLALVVAAGAGHDDVRVVIRPTVGLANEMLAGRATASICALFMRSAPLRPTMVDSVIGSRRSWSTHLPHLSSLNRRRNS